jgi:hypothetical protein
MGEQKNGVGGAQSNLRCMGAVKVREKLEYMHANPVMRKLVEHPKEWPWSSWSHYEKSGKVLIAIDSAEEK